MSFQMHSLLPLHTLHSLLPSHIRWYHFVPVGEKNISVSDDLIEMLISDDAEKTKSSVDSFITAFQLAVEKAVKDALKGNPPKKTSEPTSITKEQIMEVKDPLERQKLISEHMDLFQK